MADQRNVSALSGFRVHAQGTQRMKIDERLVDFIESTASKAVLILSGIPGSGKSTLARGLEERYGIEYASVDAYFKPDYSDFAPERLPEAHQWCLMSYLSALQDPKAGRIIVVDNTNTTAVEIAPYYALAEALGATPLIVRVDCDPAVAFARQTHGVPLRAHEAMWERWSDTSAYAPWWKVLVVS
ncbi:MAG: ATP-binding protein [Armatimonadetes bacterium]|nr:MAG: ATP-binding protein [Armatimonadota bacterium]